jgi:hypothetical protein
VDRQFGGEAPAEYDSYKTAQKTYDLVFSFTKATGTVSGSITDPSGSPVASLNRVMVGSTAGLNSMEILVADDMANSGVALENVMLNGTPLGNFGTVDVAGTPGKGIWMVSGFDFDQDWTVTADMVVDGFDGEEKMKVEFNVGFLT